MVVHRSLCYRRGPAQPSLACCFARYLRVLTLPFFSTALVSTFLSVSCGLRYLPLDFLAQVDVIFDNALSTCDIVNSKDVQMQCTGTAPSINIDGCVAVTCYLSAESFEAAHVITSKSAAINLIVPVGDDIKETPIPEQFLTKYVNGAWVTEAVSHDD